MATSDAARRQPQVPPRPPAARRSLLDVVPYFTGLSAQARADVEGRLQRMSLEKGEAALREGEANDRLFFVGRGRLKLLRTSETGREHILRLLRPGDSFNEVAVFDGGPAPATALALEPATLYILRRKDMMELLGRYPSIAEQATRYLAGQLRELVVMVEDLSFKHVSARLAKLLLAHAQSPTTSGPGGLREQLTQQDMAAMIGTAREVVARSAISPEQVDTVFMGLCMPTGGMAASRMAALKAGLDVLGDALSAAKAAGAGTESKGKIVIGTVKGDMHDIGKNLVIMMLEGAGYRVVDLGIDVPTERFIQAFDEHKPQVVGLSALLTTTMPQMKETVEALRAHHDKVRIAVGGAPVTDRFAREIGADGYAADAATAVDIVAAMTAKA